jgi:hypothetical protein
VLETIGQGNEHEASEPGDIFEVPLNFDIPLRLQEVMYLCCRILSCAESFSQKTVAQAWNLNEWFNISLKSIRVDIMNDIITSHSARRIPVVELLILVDPRSEGHGYGNIRHMSDISLFLLGFWLSINIAILGFVLLFGFLTQRHLLGNH